MSQNFAMFKISLFLLLVIASVSWCSEKQYSSMSKTELTKELEEKQRNAIELIQELSTNYATYLDSSMKSKVQKVKDMKPDAKLDDADVKILDEVTDYYIKKFHYPEGWEEK